MSTQSSTDGSGQLAHDTKLSNVWNSVVAALIVAGVTVLGGIDWSSWPAWVGTIGAPLAGLATGWLTGKALPRFKRP
jgi:hypothetical protein